MDNEKIGVFLKEKRIKSGIKSHELAEILNYHHKYITYWEKGLSRPPDAIMHKYSEALKFHIKEYLKVFIDSSDCYVNEILFQDQIK